MGAAGQAEQNKQAVQAMWKAITGGDPAAAFTVMIDLFDPDVVVYEPESLPYGGVYRGREEFLAMMGGSFASYFDSSRIQLERIVAEGDHVVARWRYPWRASTDDEFVEVEVNEWLTFRDGKIIEAKPFYWDTAALVHVGASANPKM